MLWSPQIGFGGNPHIRVEMWGTRTRGVPIRRLRDVGYPSWWVIRPVLMPQ